MNKTETREVQVMIKKTRKTIPDLLQGWKAFPVASLVLMLLFITACGSASISSTNSPAAPSASTAEPSASAPEKKLIPVTQVTNWFAGPEHGGQYTALMKDFYKDAGIDMTIQPGGPQVSATTIVASGKAQFGMAQADDLLLARQQGVPIVAIAAVFQKSPQILIYHKNDNIKGFADLNGRKVYVSMVSSYWEFLKNQFKLEKVQEMKYTGQLVNFVNDPTAVTQGYLTFEPFMLKQQNVDVSLLMIADSGYNPYTNVLITTEKLLKEDPELVKAYLDATVKGWYYYKDHSEEIYPFLQQYNPDLTSEATQYGVEVETELIFGGDAAQGGFGIMSGERWSTLIKQLVDLGVLKQAENASKVFTNDYLPKS
jgi:NitT/TauT family transport system substrate-binding protein